MPIRLELTKVGASLMVADPTGEEKPRQIFEGVDRSLFRIRGPRGLAPIGAFHGRGGLSWTLFHGQDACGQGSRDRGVRG